MNQIIISNQTKRQAVEKVVKVLMKGQKGWKKNKDLMLLEFKVEEALVSALNGYKGIKINE